MPKLCQCGLNPLLTPPRGIYSESTAGTSEQLSCPLSHGNSENKTLYSDEFIQKITMEHSGLGDLKLKT